MSNSPTSDRTRIVLFEEHATQTELLSSYLATKLRGSYEVVGTAGSLSELTRLCRKTVPDIIIFEPVHSEFLPLEIVGHLLKTSRRVNLLAFTRSRSAMLFLEMRRIGVRAVVTRDTPLSSLITTIKSVAAGDFFFPEESNKIPESTQLPFLTEREKEVVYWVSLGYPTRVIAERMSVTRKTIDKFRQKIMNKVGAHDAVALTRFAITNGLSRI